MKNKTYQFTTSTTAGKTNYNNLNKVPEQGSIKLIIDDKSEEEGLEIEMNLNKQQIRMLGFLLGSQANKKNIFKTLEVLIEIVETAKEEIISKTIIDNEVKKLKKNINLFQLKKKKKIHTKNSKKKLKKLFYLKI